MKKTLYLLLLMTSCCFSQGGDYMYYEQLRQAQIPTGAPSLDYTNLLENTTDIDADFDFYDVDGVIQSGIEVKNTHGNWCLETATGARSGNSGATTLPTGRTAYTYFEASSPSVNDPALNQRKYIVRKTPLDNTNQDLNVSILHNLNFESVYMYFFEYATVASPDFTPTSTDWTTLETVSGNLTDAWVLNTFDLSTAPATSTLWLRIRFLAYTYQADVSFSTWREFTN